MRRYGRKKQGHMAEKYCHNKKKIGEEKTKTREDKQKKMIKLQFFQNCHFWTTITKRPAHSIFWCMVIPLGPQPVYA